MRRRLYFVLPDLFSAETIEKELLLAKIDDPHMHFLAKDGINLGGLHVANLLQRSDVVHGMGIGVVVGGLVGILIGATTALSALFGSGAGMAPVLILGVIGALLGTWVSGMIAVSVPNTRIKQFQSAIDRGEILLMVDVPVRRVAEIRELIVSHHPEAKAKGLDTHIPAFP